MLANSLLGGEPPRVCWPILLGKYQARRDHVSKGKGKKRNPQSESQHLGGS